MKILDTVRGWVMGQLGMFEDESEVADLRAQLELEQSEVAILSKAVNERDVELSRLNSMLAEVLRERDLERSKHVKSHLRLTAEIERLWKLNDELIDGKGGGNGQVLARSTGPLLREDEQAEGNAAPQGKSARSARKGRTR
jgi:hypothetical protein